MAEQDVEAFALRARESLRDLLGDLPTGYESRAARISALRRVVHDEIAKALEPVFNDKLQTMPHATLAEKRELAAWANDELRRLGLAIKCHSTGKPAILLASQDRATDTAGRFRMETRLGQGRTTRTLNTRELQRFDLMPDAPRIEPLATRFRRGRGDDRVP